MQGKNANLILDYLKDHPLSSSKSIHNALSEKVAYATVKRILSNLSTQGVVVSEGKSKATKYSVSASYELLQPLNVEEYFKQEIDERQIKDGFNLKLITEVLRNVKLFNDDEDQYLKELHRQFRENIATLTPAAYSKELERLAIDLSWKSSQIEGNTYSLLETERLLKEQETAEGKPKDDATMLLNHKEAINFIVAHPDYVVPLTIRSIEDIHSLLIKDLGVDRNIRHRRVGISGTNYKPLDNEHQIREALNDLNFARIFRSSRNNASSHNFKEQVYDTYLIS
ncbi:BlaI/MecI/CopY family transcriptional regulator [Pedobacter borealis]|uniref:BlaI/MecI/CopY family transcriptional regulator n=1 Tax=Pedobacter borealis TaxID=475254 RepID=UPI00068D9F8E|nr:BlaI/MecI/CopY family transcriptional regulator [Pedobacter borealis]